MGLGNVHHGLPIPNPPKSSKILHPKEQEIPNNAPHYLNTLAKRKGAETRFHKAQNFPYPKYKPLAGSRPKISCLAKTLRRPMMSDSLWESENVGPPPSNQNPRMYPFPPTHYKYFVTPSPLLGSLSLTESPSALLLLLLLLCLSDPKKKKKEKLLCFRNGGRQRKEDEGCSGGGGRPRRRPTPSLHREAAGPSRPPGEGSLSL